MKKLYSFVSANFLLFCAILLKFSLNGVLLYGTNKS